MPTKLSPRSMPFNGGSKIAFWLLGALLAIAMSLGGVLGKMLDERITKVESTEQVRGDALYDLRLQLQGLRAEIAALRENLCRLEGKVDDVREDIGVKHVYRTPCP